MYEISMMIDDDIARIHEMYRIPYTFQLHASGPKDRVTSSLTNHLAVYKDLNVGLRFPCMTLSKISLINTKSSLHNSSRTLRILTTFVILYHFLEI